MQRFCATILLIFYFIASTGFVVNEHYCMGEPAGMELGTSSAEDCGKCGMPVAKKGGCCADEVMVLKVQQDSPATTFAVYHFSAPALLQTSLSPLLTQVVKDVDDHFAPKAHAPPLIGAPALYLSNCVFRI